MIHFCQIVLLYLSLCLCVVICKKLWLWDVADNVNQNEAADLSTLFDVGGIIGTFSSRLVVASCYSVMAYFVAIHNIILFPLVLPALFIAIFCCHTHYLQHRWICYDVLV